MERVRAADVAELAVSLLGLGQAELLAADAGLLRRWWPGRSG